MNTTEDGTPRHGKDGTALLLNSGRGRSAIRPSPSGTAHTAVASLRVTCLGLGKLYFASLPVVRNPVFLGPRLFPPHLPFTRTGAKICPLNAILKCQYWTKLTQKRKLARKLANFVFPFKPACFAAPARPRKGSHSNPCRTGGHARIRPLRRWRSPCRWGRRRQC